MSSTTSSNPPLEPHLLTLLSARFSKNPASTLCPSEVPRTLEKEGTIPHGTWRNHMDATRTIAFRLRDEGILDVLQRGEIIECGIDEVRGPIRLRLREEAAEKIKEGE